MGSAANDNATVDLQEILVQIPPVAEIVTTGLAQLRPQFNLTDEQIERLGRRPIAGAK